MKNLMTLALVCLCAAACDDAGSESASGELPTLAEARMLDTAPFCADIVQTPTPADCPAGTTWTEVTADNVDEWKSTIGGIGSVFCDDGKGNERGPIGPWVAHWVGNDGLIQFEVSRDGFTETWGCDTETGLLSGVIRVNLRTAQSRHYEDPCIGACFKPSGEPAAGLGDCPFANPDTSSFCDL